MYVASRILLYVVWCKNRSYTSIYYTEAHRYQTPHERRFGIKPKLIEIVAVGSKCWAYIDKSTRLKMDGHVFVGYFIGYPYNAKGYLIYDPSRLEIYLRYHVLFDERVKYGDELGEKKRASDARQSDHDELVRKDREELESANADDELARNMRTHVRRELDVGMEDGMTESAHRSVSAAARASLAQNPLSSPLPLNPSVAPTPSRLQLPPTSTPFQQQRPPTNPQHAPTPSNPTVRRSTRANMQRVQEDSFMDARYQLGNRKQWTHMHCSTPTRPIDCGRIISSTTTPTLQLLAISIAASVDQMFNRPSSPSASYMPPMIAALTSDLRSDCEKKLDLQYAASSVWLQKDGYVDPKNIGDAWNRPYPECAMFRKDSDHEVNYIILNGIAKPVDRTAIPGINVLTCHWVISMKWQPVVIDGITTWTPMRGRCRWVPHGNKQIEGVDYDAYGVSSPVARTESFFILFSITAQYSLFTSLIDIEKAFYLGDLQEEVYTELPPGYRNGKHAVYGRNTCWRLYKAVNGLKQSGHAYYRKVKKDMEANGYRCLKADCCVFMRICRAPTTLPLSDFAKKHGGHDILIIALWVDDNKISYSAPHMIAHFRSTLTKCGYGFRDLGEWKYSLGMDVEYSRAEGKLSISHTSYLSALFKSLPFECIRAGKGDTVTPAPAGAMLHAKDCDPLSLVDDKYWWSKHFRKCLGAMSHVKNWTFPELAIVISMLSQFMSCPGQVHWDFLFRVLCYVYTNRAAKRFFLKQTNGRNFFGYADADYAASSDTRRSRTGYCFFLFGNLVANSSRLQHCVTLSTCEAEFLALVAAAQFALWACQLIRELGVQLPDCMELFCDNKSAAAIAHTPVGHKYTKHIDIRLMFLKELCCDRKIFDIVFTGSATNLANTNTKTTANKEFLPFRDILKNLSRDHPALRDRVFTRFSEMDFIKTRIATSSTTSHVLYSYKL